MSYGAAIDALTTAPAAPKTVKLTIPEGRRARRSRRSSSSRAAQATTCRRATARAARTGARRARGPRARSRASCSRRPTSSSRGAPVAALVKQQLAAFRNAFGKVSLGYAKRKNLTRYDVLIIASMIEREAQLPKDRPLIAAVIYNRLHAATCRSASTRRCATRCTTGRSRSRSSELQSNTPYNTRTHKGLPPTPIGNPGLASLQAAAHPAHVPYLFYVVKPCGNGAPRFSSTEAKFQPTWRSTTRPPANGGKSPANCK